MKNNRLPIHMCSASNYDKKTQYSPLPQILNCDYSEATAFESKLVFLLQNTFVYQMTIKHIAALSFISQAFCESPSLLKDTRFEAKYYYLKLVTLPVCTHGYY